MAVTSTVDEDERERKKREEGKGLGFFCWRREGAWEEDRRNISRIGE